MKYLWILIALAVIALGVTVGINTEQEEVNPNFTYDLSDPLERIKLPKDLKEISGLCWWDDHEVAGIQDEDGFVFIIDTKKEKVEQREKFTKDGDYEGIALVGKKLYITRSDGRIFRIKDYDKKDQKTKVYKTPLDYDNDVEGLCYDEISNSLLLLCKDRSGLKKHKKHKRSVYAFSLETKELRKKPWMQIDTRGLSDFVTEQTGRKKEKNFMPSGIEIHPKTGNIFIISSVGELIVEIDREGNLISCSALPKGTFSQPEGITFDPEGFLYISNEGRDGAADILKFGPATP